MWVMAFQKHKHVKQSERGMPTDPEKNVEHYAFRINFPNFSWTLIFLLLLANILLLWWKNRSLLSHNVIKRGSSYFVTLTKTTCQAAVVLTLILSNFTEFKFNKCQHDYKLLNIAIRYFCYTYLFWRVHVSVFRSKKHSTPWSPTVITWYKMHINDQKIYLLVYMRV